MLNIGQRGGSGSVLASVRELGVSQRSLERSLARLSSGTRLVSSSDDAGGLAVSMKLGAALTRVRATASNLQNAVSFLQMQDAALKSIGDIVQRMEELKVMSLDVTKNARDRANYQTEFAALQEQIATVSEMKFGGIRLFAKELDSEFLEAKIDDVGRGSIDLEQFTLKECDHSWMSANMARYTFVSGNKTHAEAAADAESKCGKLAVVRSDAVWEEITRQIGEDSTRRAWIGGEQSHGSEPAGVGKNEAEQTWAWSDAESISSFRWGSDQPDDVGLIGSATVDSTAIGVGQTLTGLGNLGTGFLNGDIGQTVNLVGSDGSGAGAVARIDAVSGGAVTQMTVVTAGTGYGVNTLQIEDPHHAGVMIGPITSRLGVVNGVALSSSPIGEDFGSTVPEIVLIGGGGVGATGAAVVGGPGGSITGVSINSGGYGYSSSPEVWVRYGSQNYLEVNASGSDGMWNDVGNVSLGSEGYILERGGDYLSDVSLEKMSETLQFIASCRAENGAVQSRLQKIQDNLGSYSVNLEAANSRIADVDVAQETVSLMRAKILTESCAGMIRQGLDSDQFMLRLLQA